MDRDESALPHLPCRTIVLLFIGSIAAWIVAGYVIGTCFGAW